MKKKTKSRLADFLFLFFCLFACFLFLWLFWRDLNRTSVRNDKTQIASIYFKRRVAQRKYSDRVVWERLAQSSPLYDNDILKIAKEAQASIKFKNNAELHINENTMLQILTNKDGSVSINLSGGDVTIDTTAAEEGSSVSVLMDDGTKMNLSAGSKMTASKNDSGENNFQVQNGQAKIEKSDGTSEKLEGGTAVNVSSDGNVERKSICVTSVGKNFELLKFDGDKDNSVTLKWISSGKNEIPVRVEISEDENFKKITKIYEVSQSDQVVIENPEKNFYWRIYPLENQNDVEEGKVTVEKVPPVELLSPSLNSAFGYRKNLPKIKFSWKGNDFAAYYDFSVFRQDDLSNPVFTKQVQDENLVVENLQEGNYVWKVAPFYEINGIGGGKESKSGNFLVAQEHNVEPAKLVLPADGAKIAVPAVSEEARQSKISFVWKSDVDDASYDFMISDSADFSNVVYKRQTEDTRIIEKIGDLNLSDNTEYFWKILRSSNDDTDETRESQARNFRIEKEDRTVTKLLYPPENFSVEKQKLEQISFVWRLGKNQSQNSQKNAVASSEPQNNVIQFSRQKDFSSVDFSESASGNQISKISLDKSGKWFWRVKNDESVSEANSLVVLEKLAAPEILSPSDGEKLILPPSNSLSVKWRNQSESQIDFYKVVLSDNLGNKIEEKTLAAQNHEAFFSLPALEKQNYKNFQISVQSFSSATEISDSRISDKAESGFSAKNPLSLVLLSPSQNQNIQGLDALRNPVNFIWKENDKIAENTSALILSRQENNGSWRTVQKIKNPKAQVQISNLSPGRYQWTVEAAGFGGVNLSAESASYFTVLEIPHLPLPVLTSPKDNLVMNADYLKKNRSITFTWQKVEGATDYVFELYQKTANGGLRKITKQTTKRTSYRFRNLKNLDVAGFEWHVTAYLYGRGGVEEQNSRTAESEFAIRFSLPQKIQTEDPGTQYGE